MAKKVAKLKIKIIKIEEINFLTSLYLSKLLNINELKISKILSRFITPPPGVQDPL